ncbi:hypothetical protein FACS189483_02470 [Spirochaetia bacterium]|nr:hypothetical protein FACS189483_02470 [Spirochaetia bacterium]
MVCREITDLRQLADEVIRNNPGEYQEAITFAPPLQCMEIGMFPKPITLIPRPPKECGLVAALNELSTNDKKIYEAIKRGILGGIIEEVDIGERKILNFHFSLSSVGILFAKCTIPREHICLFSRYTSGKKELADFTIESLNNCIYKLEVNNKDWFFINKILKMPDPY